MNNPVLQLPPYPMTAEEIPDLLPGQVELYGRLLEASRAAPIIGFNYVPSMGGTTLMRRLARDLGALLIDGPKVSTTIRAYPALRWEEPIYEMIKSGLQRYGTVVVDECRELSRISYPFGIGRGALFHNMMRHLYDYAIQNDYHLVMSGTPEASWYSVRDVFGQAASIIMGHPLQAEDYHEMFARGLGRDRVVDVNFRQIHRGSPALDLHQLNAIINLIHLNGGAAHAVTTGEIEGIIETKIIRSNLNLKEVEELSFDNLPGTEHIAEALEMHVVLPFCNKALARDLELKPKRGVLLYGPPGTGKTSIGRALAHRMAGRFFLIDGSFVTEPPSWFFASVEQLVAEAKKNTPCVLFIDDADVLFEIPHIAGLARYLLSLLDGIESETASNVCIMMTAMDPKKVPDALLRSGRVELWLETRAPDEATRASILARWIGSDLPGLEEADYAELARKSAGFTPADLRRLTSDAKLLYAADIAKGKAPHVASAYLNKAIEDLIATRSIMADRLADDALRIRAYA
jgi:transitional endoplasmic reticulum ATPase